MSPPSSSSTPPLASSGGFSFDHMHRNASILSASASSSSSTTTTTTNKFPTKKTGTTIVGCVFDNGVVLGADTRATGGTEVAEKNCEKIHYLAPNMYCCGAGTAADTDKTTELISSKLELLRMDLNDESSQSKVITACTMLKRMLFQYQGYISAALVLGGCDADGPHVYQIYPHGSTGKLPYTTMGSGSLAAMAVFESEWRADMNESEALEVVQRAIGAGIFNDLGSGSNCDTCVIRLDGTVDYTRGAVQPNAVQPLRDAIRHSDTLKMKEGTTPVLHSQFVPTLKDVVVVDVTSSEGGSAMEE